MFYLTPCYLTCDFHVKIYFLPFILFLMTFLVYFPCVLLVGTCPPDPVLTILHHERPRPARVEC